MCHMPYQPNFVSPGYPGMQSYNNYPGSYHRNVRSGGYRSLGFYPSGAYLFSESSTYQIIRTVKK
jgi:hypothetical protein